MRIYVAGKMSELPDGEARMKFAEAAMRLRERGHLVMDPAVQYGNPGFEHEDYMHVCYAMIDRCEAVYMLSDWRDSKGARLELQYAADWGKAILYEDEHTCEEGYPVVHGDAGYSVKED